MISHEILDEVARRIVENFHPEKIILFGSQAQGTADSHSDVDILVISTIKEKRRKLMVDMRSVLNELEYAFDLIILTREEFERDRKISGNRPYRLIAYHAQQCAEKYLKAYMVYHDTDFPYTHDIQKLLNLCGSHIWIAKIKDAEELTPYAISARYPGMDEPVTEDEDSFH